MSTIMTNWDKQELEAYMLLFCANADFVEKKEEQSFILSHVDQKTYDKMHAEFDADNDYERIQKMMSTFVKLDIYGEERDAIVQKLMALMLSDGSLDPLEDRLLRLLKRLI